MMRRRGWVAVVGLLLLLVPLAAPAQSAVVKRNVNLRTGPSTAFPILRLLLPGDELALREPVKTQNYYAVRVADGDEGWVWAPDIRVLQDASAVDTASAGPPDEFPSRKARSPTSSRAGATGSRTRKAKQISPR